MPPAVLTTAFAFLRGINVGGRNMLPMADLRRVAEAIGLHSPRTHIQSGNLIFQAAKPALSTAADSLASAIEAEFGFRPAVVVRTRDELAKALAANPFADLQNPDPAKLLIMLLAAKPPASATAALAALNTGAEQCRLVDMQVWLWFPNGVARAKLPMASIERAVAVPGTCRNVATLTKVLALAGEV